MAENAKTNSTYEKVREIIANQLSVKAEQITEKSNIAEDLGADSLDVVELVMALEEKFEVEIPDSEAEKLKTIQDVVTFVEGLKK